MDYKRNEQDQCISKCLTKGMYLEKLFIVWNGGSNSQDHDLFLTLYIWLRLLFNKISREPITRGQVSFFVRNGGSSMFIIY